MIHVRASRVLSLVDEHEYNYKELCVILVAGVANGYIILGANSGGNN